MRRGIVYDSDPGEAVYLHRVRVGARLWKCLPGRSGVVLSCIQAECCGAHLRRPGARSVARGETGELHGTVRAHHLTNRIALRSAVGVRAIVVKYII